MRQVEKQPISMGQEQTRGEVHAEAIVLKFDASGNITTLIRVKTNSTHISSDTRTVQAMMAADVDEVFDKLNVAFKGIQALGDIERKAIQ